MTDARKALESAREALATIERMRTPPSPVQRLGAAISRRDWHEAEQAHNTIRDLLDSVPALAAIDAALASGGQGWQVKDYADGWIDFATAEEALAEVRAMGGALVRPAPSPVVPSGLEALVERLNGVAFMLKTAQTMGEIAVGKGQSPFEVVESAVSSLVAVAAQRDDARKIADTFGREGHELRERVAALIAERDEEKSGGPSKREGEAIMAEAAAIERAETAERALSAAHNRIAEIEGETIERAVKAIADIDVAPQFDGIIVQAIEAVRSSATKQEKAE